MRHANDRRIARKRATEAPPSSGSCRFQLREARFDDRNFILNLGDRLAGIIGALAPERLEASYQSCSMRPQVFERSTIAVAHVHVDDGSYCRMIHALLLLRGCRMAALAARHTALALRCAEPGPGQCAGRFRPAGSDHGNNAAP
jgi:hypothetical protein